MLPLICDKLIWTISPSLYLKVKNCHTGSIKRSEVHLISDGCLFKKTNATFAVKLLKDKYVKKGMTRLQQIQGLSLKVGSREANSG